MMPVIHEQPSQADVNAMVERLGKKYVAFDRDTGFRDHLDRLLQSDASGHLVPEPRRFGSTDETRGVAVIGGAGSGKTSLVARAMKRHPALQPSEAVPKPCVSITVPNPATMKSVGLEILKQTGYPEAQKPRTAWEIWNCVRIRFEVLGTVVLVIDEAHDLFPTGYKSEAPEILKTLKSLMQGPGSVIVILCGVESLFDRLAFDDQIQRRFSKFELSDVATAADRKMLWDILCTFCAEAGLGHPERGDLVERLVHAGRHRFGRCVEQIIGAIEIALKQGDEDLDIQHFADSFYLQESCWIDRNVFLAPRWSTIDLNSRDASHAA
jgi:hypothetical protein